MGAVGTAAGRHKHGQKRQAVDILTARTPFSTHEISSLRLLVHGLRVPTLLRILERAK